MSETKRDWCAEVEHACREAIAKIPGFRRIPELAYFQAIEEGLDPIIEGARARIQELDEEVYE